MKADGYDAVTVYFDWDYNSPAPGRYDFGGVRNYNTFLNMAQEAGLYVIARPGPYINAETDGGGIPSWVLTAANGYRTYTQPYLSAALQWMSQINPIIAAHQVTKGGNVIAYQVENEYATQGSAADQYMAALEQQATADGIDVPFAFNQCCGSQTFTAGTGAVNISGTDNYPLGFDCANPANFGQPQSGYPVYAGEPIFLPEYQGGSFDGWGAPATPTATARPELTSRTSITITSTWDAARGDLRLDYVHNGLAEVEITGGGASPLELLIADTKTAEEFWPETTSAGPVLVEGGYLVRTASVRNGRLELTSDTTKAGSATVWAGGTVRSVEWNGRFVGVTKNANGSLTGTVGGPQPVTLPTLTNWKFASEAPEAQPGFSDSNWTLADHPVSNASSPPVPVLYASDYGYDHGFVWYRGHFTATGAETGVTLTADGISPTGAYSVWLNGAFLGSGSAAGAQTQTFTLPPDSVVAGQDNVLAVLVENTGNPEGPSGEKVGLYGASLVGSSAAVTWRLMGDPGGSTLQDPMRGIMNGSGLYGSDNGWDLPGYPVASWTNVTLPDNWSSRGDAVG